MSHNLDGQKNITVTDNITLSGLTSTQHNSSVYAKDIYGNVGSSEKVTFEVAVSYLQFSFIAIAIKVIFVVAFYVVFYFRKRCR
ncbi:MAG: hypothetical protein PHC63_08980 [Candidatus Bathyarchaeota archaeon]|nr:hypothetical protein [Candidatus Bathyarchaeota archaeon]